MSQPDDTANRADTKLDRAVRKHLISIDDLSKSSITEILDLAPRFAEVASRRISKVPTLRGKTVALVFFEDSTRTRISFETAAKRLSADTLNVSIKTSSVKKGESLRDTALTIEAMGVDAVIVRHSCSGVPEQLTRWLDASIINAGDGWHQHPTQALLDCYTLRNELGDLEGKHIAIVGDIKHSRVARSNIEAFTKLGARVTLVAPATLLPADNTEPKVEVTNSLDSVIQTKGVDKVDALYLLRMQSERQSAALVPDLAEYHREYGLTMQRACALGPDIPILHPGPMNRGVEIDAEVPELKQSVVLDQVRNGVAIRMAVLFLVLTGGAGILPPTAHQSRQGESSSRTKGASDNDRGVGAN